ncbi:hypothetical protein ABXT06_05320 [Flavobacterium sp. UW10123]|uniref:hypothetical protein n=1 Tax=Flavobacterium sp. UW10123 TaxID=3230800 RepID=UPI00339B6ECF
MNDEKIVMKFAYIKSDEENIEAVYQNNFLLYKYELSDIKYVKIEDFEYDDNGMIQRSVPLASYSSEGFHIEEKDFQKSEMKALSAIKLDEMIYGEQRKFNIYKDYIELKMEFKGWYKVKNRNGFYTIKRSGIDKFKKGIYSFYFKSICNRRKEDGTENEFYYDKRTRDWKKQRDELLKANDSFQARLELLSIYNVLLARLMEKTVRLFMIVDQYDGSEIGYINKFNILKSELLQALQVIGNYSQNINHNINTGHYKIALEIQHYCILMFNDILSVLDNSFFLKIDRTPLKKDFDLVHKQLNDAIDLNKLDLLLRLGSISKVPSRSDSVFNFEQNDSIFKTLEGEMIFRKFYAVYKTESKGQQSNFSFLFYALKKNNLINCSTSNYISFCKEYKIKINTVDTRMNYDYLDIKNSLIVDYEKFASEANAYKKEGEVKV